MRIVVQSNTHPDRLILAVSRELIAVIENLIAILAWHHRVADEVDVLVVEWVEVFAEYSDPKDEVQAVIILVHREV